MNQKAIDHLKYGKHEEDWKVRAAAIHFELVRNYPVAGADAIMKSAFEAIVQAQEQAGVVVRVTIRFVRDLRVIEDCFDMVRETGLVDLDKTKRCTEPGAPTWPTLEFKNGSAIEFVTLF
jgi:hypothetical protein